jgi:hypothetical protein
MNILRIALLVIGIACTGVVVFVRLDYTTAYTTASGDVTEAKMRIGFPPSPWYTRMERDGTVSSEVNLLSFSSVFVLAAITSFLGYARLRRPKPTPLATQAAAEPGAAPDRGGG